MEDKKTRRQPAVGSRWHKLGCWIWFRITILALVAILLVAYSVEVFRCGYYKPTGDALYDRYARAVISRQKWVLFHGTKHHPTYLPDSLLSEWESDFGSDPRYWQLRYFCARDKDATLSNTFVPQSKSFWINLCGFRSWDTNPTEIEDNAWEHLQTGVDKGADGWMTLEILGRETSGLRREANSAEMKALDVPGLSRAELRKATIELSRAQEQSELARVTAMVDADPSQAWPYLMRAQYWFLYGEVELALADLKAGNAAPNNESSKPFPLSFMLERMENGAQLGSNILAGAILEESTYGSTKNWIKLKDVYKTAQGMVALGGDTEILHELHLTACRLGMAKYNGHIEPRVASVVESLLAEALLVEYGADLTYMQRLAMKEMYDRAKDVHTYLKARSAETRPYLRNYPRLYLLENQYFPFGSSIENANVDPPIDRNFGWGVLNQHLKPRLYYNRALWFQQQQQVGVISVRDTFAQLEYVDLNTLEWPEEWGNPY